jgi:hypothetical protein
MQPTRDTSRGVWCGKQQPEVMWAGTQAGQQVTCTDQQHTRKSERRFRGGCDAVVPASCTGLLFSASWRAVVCMHCLVRVGPRAPRVVS